MFCGANRTRPAFYSEFLIELGENNTWAADVDWDALQGEKREREGEKKWKRTQARTKGTRRSRGKPLLSASPLRSNDGNDLFEEQMDEASGWRCLYARVFNSLRIRGKVEKGGCNVPERFFLLSPMRNFYLWNCLSRRLSTSLCSFWHLPNACFHLFPPCSLI